MFMALGHHHIHHMELFLVLGHNYTNITDQIELMTEKIKIP
jgi:hypothetical protein